MNFKEERIFTLADSCFKDFSARTLEYIKLSNTIRRKVGSELILYESGYTKGAQHFVQALRSRVYKLSVKYYTKIQYVLTRRNKEVRFCSYGSSLLIHCSNTSITEAPEAGY